MTKRPMLILNGKATRYWQLFIRLCDIRYRGDEYRPIVTIDAQDYCNVEVSHSTRPSGRRVIWVSTEGE